MMEELWITYSTGNTFTYIAIHEVVASMERNIALSLTGFHAFTGCDTTSSFKGKGKKTMYATWMGNSLYNNLFQELSGRDPEKKDVKRLFRLVQIFICELYGESGDDACRLVMLVHKGKDFENMQPTSDALYQHTLRLVHQSGNIWSHIHEPSYKEKDFADWGRRRVGSKGEEQPIYTTRPIISRSLTDLDMCGCQTRRCKNICKCQKSSQPCTPLCKCKAKCKQQQ